MSNGLQMLHDLDLESKIKDFSPAEQFLAREQYKMALSLAEIKANCPTCSSGKQKAYNYSGLTGLVVAIIVGVWQAMKGGN